MPSISTTKLITLDRHISNEEKLHPDATGELTLLLHDISLAIRLIAREVRRAGLSDILGLTENINVHGEQVRRLDEYANDVINRAMDQGGHLCVMASEESEGIIGISPKIQKGKYVLAFDPLDGSTNIDVNATIGSIFSIHQRLDPHSTEDGTVLDILQPGYKQVAAAYVLYGSSTLLVYTTGHGVNAFTYDPTLGEFFLTFENMKIPNSGRIYSCNESNYYKWDKAIQQYITYLKTPSEHVEQPYTMRYIASAVADIHRMLIYGGIYLYPPDTTKPGGKIRLVYEANPLAMIIEETGGKATTGTRRLMDIVPESIHTTVPFYVGSPDNIDELIKFLRGEHPFQNK
jgi:fructose-1,6-bisphosphatase I